MRVIITRAENESGGMAELVRRIDCEPLIASMTEIEFSEDPIDLANFQGVIATSGNAVRALAGLNEDRDIPLFCVGPQTQKLADSLGYKNTKSSLGASKNLAVFVGREVNPSNGPLVYLHGGNVAGNPVQEMAQSGIRAVPRKVYGAAPVKTLPDNVRDEFEKPVPPEFATFLSIRTFKLFREVMEKEGLIPKLKDTIAVCISPAVADFVRELRWKKVYSAPDLSANAIVQKIAELKEDQGATS